MNLYLALVSVTLVAIFIGLAAAFLVTILAALYLWVYIPFMEYEQIKQLSNRIDSYYVVGRTQGGYEPRLTNKVMELVEFVSYDLVEERASVVRMLFEQSNNDLYNLPSNDKRKLEVKTFHFQDAEFVNEDEQEYSDRIVEQVKSDLAIRHKALNSTRDWYNIHGNKQKV